MNRPVRSWSDEHGQRGNAATDWLAQHSAAPCFADVAVDNQGGQNQPVTIFITSSLL
jgi:hypothetical protein